MILPLLNGVSQQEIARNCRFSKQIFSQSPIQSQRGPPAPASLASPAPVQPLSSPAPSHLTGPNGAGTVSGARRHGCLQRGPLVPAQTTGPASAGAAFLDIQLWNCQIQKQGISSNHQHLDDLWNKNKKLDPLKRGTQDRFTFAHEPSWDVLMAIRTLPEPILQNLTIFYLNQQ